MMLSLLPAGHVLRGIYAWSSVSGVLWVAGALVPEDRRALLWRPALAVDLSAPLAGYRFPGLGRSATDDYDIHGGHFIVLAGLAAAVLTVLAWWEAGFGRTPSVA